MTRLITYCIAWIAFSATEMRRTKQAYEGNENQDYCNQDYTIVCKIGSFNRVLKSKELKSSKTKQEGLDRYMNLRIWNEFQSGIRFSFITMHVSTLNSKSNAQTDWIGRVIQDWNSIQFHVNYPWVSLVVSHPCAHACNKGRIVKHVIWL